MKKHAITKFELNRPWRSLSAFNTHFHENINIFVGVNSSGKSSLLDLINANTRLYNSVLADNEASGHIASFTNQCPAHETENTVNIWEDEKNGFVGGITPKSENKNYIVRVRSLYFSANRGTDTSSANTFNKQEPYTLKEVYETLQSNQKLRMSKWTLFIEKVLLGWIVASAPQSKYLDSDVKNQQTYEKLLNDFSNTLADFFPSYLRFERLVNRNNEINFVFGGSPIKLKHLSSGIEVLLEYMFGIFIFDKIIGGNGSHTGYCVLIDEIENHIHPKLERELVPRLSAAFPSAQFFIATHSAVVASSTNKSKIFILKEKESQDRLQFEPLEQDMNTSIDSFSTTLYEVIGLPTLIPYWLEREFDEVYETTRKESEAEHLDEFLETTQRQGIGVWATMYWNSKINGSDSD